MTHADSQPKQRESAVGDATVGGNALVAWILAAVILLSFAFGVFMYGSPEQRAQKFKEIKHKYEAKQHYYNNLKGSPSGRTQQ